MPAQNPIAIGSPVLDLPVNWTPTDLGKYKSGMRWDQTSGTWLPALPAPVPYWQSPNYHGSLAGQAPPSGKIWDSRTGTFVNPPPGYQSNPTGPLTPSQIATNEGTKLSPAYQRMLGLGGTSLGTTGNALPIPQGVQTTTPTPMMNPAPTAKSSSAGSGILGMAMLRGQNPMMAGLGTPSGQQYNPAASSTGKQTSLPFGSQFFQPGRFWGMQTT